MGDLGAAAQPVDPWPVMRYALVTVIALGLSGCVPGAIGVVDLVSSIVKMNAARQPAPAVGAGNGDGCPAERCAGIQGPSLIVATPMPLADDARMNRSPAGINRPGTASHQ